MTRPLLILALAALATPAAACQAPGPRQETDMTAPASVEDGFGMWSLIPASGGGSSCTVALGKVASGDAYGLHFEGCDISGMKRASAWRPVAGGLELLASDGTVLIAFRHDGPDRLNSTDGAWRLSRAMVR